MTRESRILRNALLALQQQLAPALAEQPQARSALGSLTRIVSSLVADAEATHARVTTAIPEDPAAALKVLGAEQAWLDARTTLAASLLVPPAPDASAAAAPRARHIDRAGFERWLAACPEVGAGVRVQSFAPLLGGRSRHTMLVRLEDPDGRFDGEYVIRQDAAVNLTFGISTVEEALIMRTGHAAGLRVPRVVLSAPAAPAWGGPFLVMERLPGAAATSYWLDPPPTARIALDLAAILGRQHAMPVAAFAGIADSLGADIEPLDDIDFVEKTLAGAGWIGPLERFTFDWLRRNVHLMRAAPPALVHRDALFHNVLVHEGGVVALLDWELARLGQPAEDLGYIRRAVEEVVDWGAFIAAYEAAGGPRIDELQISYFGVWGTLRCIGMQANIAGYLDNGMTDVELSAVTVYDRYLCLRQLVLHLRRALTLQA